jgi:hypothetical protein
MGLAKKLEIDQSSFSGKDAGKFLISFANNHTPHNTQQQKQKQKQPKTTHTHTCTHTHTTQTETKL